MSPRSAQVSRADLLRLIDGVDECNQDTLAALTGYKRRPEQTKPFRLEEESKPKPQPFKPTASPEPKPEPSLEIPLFWRVIAKESFRETDIDQQDIPKCFRETKTAGTPVDPGISLERPQEISLLHWPRLLGFFRRHLVIQHPTQALDERLLVRHLAEARPLKRFPRKTCCRWPAQIVVVVDKSDTLYPLRADYNRLLKRFQDTLGARMKILKIAAYSQPYTPHFESLLDEARLTPEVSASARWLILSDAGAVKTPDNDRAQFWQTFLRWLQDYTPRNPALALINAPPSQWWKGLDELADAAFWDLDCPMRLSLGAAPGETDPTPGIDKLFAMLSMAREARPRLLRKLRRLLPPNEQDVSWEIAVWNNKDVERYGVSCFISPNKRPNHQNNFEIFLKNAKSAEDWPHQVAEIIKNDHRGMRPQIQSYERVQRLAMAGLPDDDPDFIVDVIYKILDLPAGWERNRLLKYLENLITASHPQLINRNDKLGAVRYIVHRERRLRGETPPELDPRFDFIFAQKPAIDHFLWQQGEGLCIREQAVNETTAISGSPVGVLSSRNTLFELRFDDSFHDSDFWTSGSPPSWATDWGEDEFGRWAEFQIETQNGQPVRQRLRWIPPGRFKMGSPQGEAERRDNETQHEVELSEGYWLGDTVCTQGLWEAVMGDNPSQFKGAERPVEQVSWEEAMEFISRLNQQVAGLELRLPSEAEWEYACRAGSETPFWFGENISPAQVNYDGNHPYAGGKKGKYRKQTVEVKALPCNGWGLYQMHGNVWEWCSDWYGAYPSGSVTDPRGPDSGGSRVLHGGSWLYYGGSARSAQRLFITPDNRDINVGFRLARGQSGGEPVDPQASRQAERRAPAGQPGEAPVPLAKYGIVADLRAIQGNRIIVASDCGELSLETIVKPNWASAIGRDQFGLFTEIEIENSKQRLRWINPGRFKMGSPGEEAERDDDEVQHEVELSEGYWLGDTVCTQGLWEAVMGDNPSRFKGAQRPVERVSWEEAMEFIHRLNQQVAGLELRLPSEAEWEYACRAGRETPFWFGENISPAQVNYNGEHPYAGGKRGKYREETVEVKALPCNGWGLYQMHGNVWEWCSDWYGAYPSGSVTDPHGPENGERRVLRGGGWDSSGWYARSAQRINFSPDFRSYFVGFRLARGQSGGEPVSAGAGQASRSGDGQAPADFYSRIKGMFKK